MLSEAHLLGELHEVESLRDGVIGDLGKLFLLFFLLLLGLSIVVLESLLGFLHAHFLFLLD